MKKQTLSWRNLDLSLRLRPVNECHVEDLISWMEEERGEEDTPIADEVPLVVVQVGATYYLCDGFHRLKAFERRGIDEVPCQVEKGTIHDARLRAATANRDQTALPFGVEDRKAAARLILHDSELKFKSDSWIGEKVGLSGTTVKKIRDGIDDAKVDHRKGKDGRWQKVGNRKGRQKKAIDTPKSWADLATYLQKPITGFEKRREVWKINFDFLILSAFRDGIPADELKKDAKRLQAVAKQVEQTPIVQTS
ncbi:MAG: ParB N-terminal domain-containing protein [Deltaproteobacteria bacterium]|nr:ParB N-terminal domain-containing protein [Deltaproteobacteria bacterium]